MASEKLSQLLETLSKPDLETVEAFIILYHQCKPNAGQAIVGLEYFLENLEKRYQRSFKGSKEILFITPEEFETALIASES